MVFITTYNQQEYIFICAKPSLDFIGFYDAWLLDFKVCFVLFWVIFVQLLQKDVQYFNVYQLSFASTLSLEYSFSHSQHNTSVLSYLIELLKK